MFRRLFLTYLLLVGLAFGLLGLIIYQRSTTLFYDLANDVGVAVVVLLLLSSFPAFAMARIFARPLAELNEGARRLADGDFDHKLQVGGGKEHIELARTFNTMSDRLAETFKQLAHDREQLRIILSGMVEGVIGIDEEQRVLFANDRAGRLLDFHPTQVVGNRLWEAIRQRPFREAVAKGLASSVPYREEFDLPGPNAHTVMVYVSRFPGPGEPGAVVVLHDTTDIRRLERMRQDFVANVSHELKTPLTIIKSTVEALQDGAAEEPELRDEFLQKTMHEADRLQELIQDLLSLARIESGELGLEFQAIPLEKAISDCVERFHTRAELKTLTVVEKPPREGPSGVAAWVDSDAMRHILDNLVDNAIKYTPNGGRVTVRWFSKGEQVEFEIQDTGVGIPEKDLPRIFERFYRVDKARSRELGGTGLGLAIVKHLVQAMKGQVKATSMEGKGTTFKVSLPRAPMG